MLSKALFLLIVYSIPAIFALALYGRASFILLALYLPFAALYVMLVWRKPPKKMLTWIALTPIFFLTFVLLTVPIYVASNWGSDWGAKIIPVTAMVIIVPVIACAAIQTFAACVLFLMLRSRKLLQDMPADIGRKAG